ncbi:hypothetical protein Tsubulata_024365 [Turnera subulata]|uniref:MYB transcription factor n=1 Tax=Turnera subulata TaxID=218843 RepID=A0A9Q0JK18_9ROSI|nr:hypothetical protein Tsubulata_024365 [Turnera subulata]
MVSVNPSPAQGFYFFDPMNMGLPGVNSLPAPPNSTAPAASGNAAAAGVSAGGGANAVVSFAEDPSKKIRKPYTITKSRESWTDQEHDKFLEALQLFDRDWKKIEAFVGSKTVIQIRSHAQKYFLKVQKNGAGEHVPPPRPKRKASHPYPQKAPKNAPPAASQLTLPFQSSSASLDPGFVYRPDSSSVIGNPITGAAVSSWSYSTVPPINTAQIAKDEVGATGPTCAQNCYSSSTESTPRTWQPGEITDRGNQAKPVRVTPDFAQVYSFIGSVFDPNASGHLQTLKQMDPINLETVLLLMRNLAVNLTNPEFEDHRRLLASYDFDSEKSKSAGAYSSVHADKSRSAIPAT